MSPSERVPSVPRKHGLKATLFLPCSIWGTLIDIEKFHTFEMASARMADGVLYLGDRQRLVTDEGQIPLHRRIAGAEAGRSPVVPAEAKSGGSRSSAA